MSTVAGRPWEEWVDLLSNNDATSQDHAGIAKLALAHMPEEVSNPEWWAQSVAVRYEQHIGRRVPGQSCTGDFQAGASKTVDGTMSEVMDAWARFQEGITEHGGAMVTGGPRRSETEKWRYWRIDVTDAEGLVTKVDVMAQDKAPGKTSTGPRSSLKVNHSQIPNSDQREHFAAYWKGVLARFMEQLPSQT